ncbi:hypothetical protein IE53DRAFT_238320 [Violaceomyces palustris]|uniref:Uncharacterized protein n=1 Tax=Violaceomyces palustris TaxID=1673888 RepID=A0ACD0NPB9_9BASI|nr:hypothetical protein IE53DRAFT_238320 [Violaceomyces palustris]
MAPFFLSLIALVFRPSFLLLSFSLFLISLPACLLPSSIFTSILMFLFFSLLHPFRLPFASCSPGDPQIGG